MLFYKKSVSVSRNNKNLPLKIQSKLNIELKQTANVNGFLTTCNNSSKNN